MKNKINLIPISLYFVWFSYLINNLYSKAHSNIIGFEYVKSFLPSLTVYFTILTLVVKSFLNKRKKLKFYNDFIYICLAFLILMII